MTGTFINNRKYLYLYLIEEKVHFQRPIRPLFAILNCFIIQKKYIYRSALTENFDNLRRCIPKAKLCKNVNKKWINFDFTQNIMRNCGKRGFSNSYLLKLKQSATNWNSSVYWGHWSPRTTENQSASSIPKKEKKSLIWIIYQL